MAGASVRADVEGLQTTLRALRGLALAGRDLRPAMDEVGRTIVDHAQLRFEAGRAPDGTPWKVSLRAASEGGQTLIDSGHLRSSMTHRAGRTSVEVGTASIYGATHQFGRGAIPARPFVGLDDADREDIPVIVARHLRQGLGR